jgi:hypothetical protein
VRLESEDAQSRGRMEIPTRHLYAGGQA